MWPSMKLFSRRSAAAPSRRTASPRSLHRCFSPSSSKPASAAACNCLRQSFVRLRSRTLPIGNPFWSCSLPNCRCRLRACCRSTGSCLWRTFASRSAGVPILSRPFWAAAHPRCPQILWTSFRILLLSALWPCRSRVTSPKHSLRAGGWGTVPRAPGFKGVLTRAARSLRPALKTAGLESWFLSLWKAASPLVGVSGQSTGRPRDLQGATVGLVGWGANARAFAERLGRAQARVLVYSEHAGEEDIRSRGAVPASLTEVLAADIVSLHRGLTESTRHCLGAVELAKLRPGTVLINIARGALIEPNALLARLKRGDIFACLDTYEEEPLIAAHPLRSLSNVFLTSHIAGGSPDNYAAAAVEVVRKVAAYLANDVTESISA